MTYNPANDIVTDYVQFVAERHEKALEMLKASESPMASALWIEDEGNKRRCKCAFCRAPLQVGEGHPYHGWRGVRYLCDNCWPPYVAKTFLSVLQIQKETE